MSGYEHWPAARVLRRARLSPAQVRAGRAHHHSGGQLLALPVALVIARHDAASPRDGDPPGLPQTSYYLFYLDEAGAELDSAHQDTLATALARAEAEFGVTAGEWEVGDADE